MLDGHDPLLELFLQAEEDDLKTRRKLEKRAEYAERHRQRKAGHTGPLVCRLAVPRRLWPAVHSRAIEAAVKITTDLLPPGVTSPVVLTTSESGAAVLCAAAPAVAVLGSEVAA
ncbi:MAG TPA: hypothetical protein VF202_04420 [Trueperaceae bacterium]